MSYYNTNGLKGQELFKAVQKAKNQNEIVLLIFKHFNKPLTPFEVHALFPDNVPITSIRRAITCLTNEGRLEQTETMVVEVYGSKNHKWKLSERT